MDYGDEPLRAVPCLGDTSAEAGPENCAHENVATIPGLRRPLNPKIWICINLPGGAVAFVRTEEWFGTVSWWLVHSTAKKLADGIVFAQPMGPHLEELTNGLGFLKKDGPWILAECWPAEKCGRA
jgi:hypothetical protein